MASSVRNLDDDPAGRSTTGLRKRVSSLLLALLGAVFAGAVMPVSVADAPASTEALDRMRRLGDLPAQRAHLRTVVENLRFMDGAWFNKAEVFASTPLADIARVPFPGLPNSARSMGPDLLGTPVLTFTHFNAPARDHIRRHRLHEVARLDELRDAASRPAEPAAAARPSAASRPSIPPFPREAAIVMTAWWPVDSRGLTPLPVWDPPPPGTRSGSQPYTRWPRVVAVDPALAPDDASIAGPAGSPSIVEFAGRRFAGTPRVGLDRFVRLMVDAPAATRLMADPLSRKAVLLALGRPLRAGDWLVLVAMHVMTHELPGGIWGTLWWHDRAAPLATGRSSIPGRWWRDYRMEVAFDAVLPRRTDGSPRIVFNPWFEAPFPKGAEGDGQQSNCANCHARAAYPAVPFLPVRRGAPDRVGDPAHAGDRLATGGVWSLARLGELP